MYITDDPTFAPIGDKCPRQKISGGKVLVQDSVNNRVRQRLGLVDFVVITLQFTRGAIVAEGSVVESHNIFKMYHSRYILCGINCHILKHNVQK